MTIEKTIHLTISKEEREILKKAENILDEVCNSFDECEDCPLNPHCVCPSPSKLLYFCINDLPVEE